MNALIIYDEFELAAKAYGILVRAANRADATLQWSVNPWRTDMLDQPPTAERAFHDAAGAHLIVIAVSGHSEISLALLSWLEAWAERREIHDAALAVFNGAQGDTLSGQATPRLTQFAERHGISFILGEVNPDESEPTSFVEQLHKREVTQTATMAHMLEQGTHDYYRGWGLNE